MSSEALAWAKRCCGVGSVAQLILVLMADWADHEDRAWPGIKTLSGMTGRSERTVIRAVKRLEEEGLIEKSTRAQWCALDNPVCMSKGAHKHRTSNVYKLNVGAVPLSRRGSGSVSSDGGRGVVSVSCEVVGASGGVGQDVPGSRVPGVESAESSHFSISDKMSLLGSISDKTGSPLVTLMSPICNKDLPEEELPDLTLGSEERDARGLLVVRSGSCENEHLDASTAGAVAGSGAGLLVEDETETVASAPPLEQPHHVQGFSLEDPVAAGGCEPASAEAESPGGCGSWVELVEAEATPSPVAASAAGIEPEPEPEPEPELESGVGGETRGSRVKLRGSRYPDAPAPSPGVAGGRLSVSGSVSGLDVGDECVIARCLPEGMQVLDAQGARMVAGLLRERLDAGWSAREIRSVMDQALPVKVYRMAALVASRLKANVDPQRAPSAGREAAEEAWREHRDAVRERQDRAVQDAMGDTIEQVDPEFQALVDQARAQLPDAGYATWVRVAFEQHRREKALS